MHCTCGNTEGMEAGRSSQSPPLQRWPVTSMVSIPRIGVNKFRLSQVRECPAHREPLCPPPGRWPSVQQLQDVVISALSQTPPWPEA